MMTSPSTNIPIAELISGRLVLSALAKIDNIHEALVNYGAKDVLLLEKCYSIKEERHELYVTKKYRRISDVRKNNCDLAILHGVSAYALLQKREFARFKHVLIPYGCALLAKYLGLLIYGRRKLLVPIGKTSLISGGKKYHYHVLEARYKMRDQTRQYAPAGLTPLEIMEYLKGVDYVSLRGYESIENGTHKGDIDLLVSKSGLFQIKERFAKKIGTYSVDLYTNDGQEGCSYKSVPYVTPALAQKIFSNSTFSNLGIRIPDSYWRFVSYCYHLLFHDKCVIAPSYDNLLHQKSFSKPHYLGELQRLAQEAGVSAPKSIDQIEDLLRQNFVMPSLDLIGFYSNRYPFLKNRYFESHITRPGLATFFVRDFGVGPEIVSTLRTRLQTHFEIVKEGAVDEVRDAAIICGVRGGNWADAAAPGGIAKPLHWFVCIDRSPIKPSQRSRRKHPRLDNENIRIKDDLRREFGLGDKKGLRIIHSSDNTLEALDHIGHLALLHDADFIETIKPWRITQS